MTTATTPEDIQDVLKTVYDPEIGINVVDLGLIYAIEVAEGGKKAKVTFTLTTPACPVGPMLDAQIREAAGSLPGVEQVETEIVFSPPWNPREMCSDEAKFELGLF